MSITQGGGGYTLTLANGNTETYNTNGRVTGEDLNGYVLTYTYNASDELQSVANDYGHALTFTYNANGRIDTITTPNSEVYSYAYDSNRNLTSVTHPDLTVRQYHYEDSNYIHALTGITDESTTRISTYAYDPVEDGWVTSTERATTDNGGSQEEFNFTYYYYDGRTVDATDANGITTRLEFSTIKGVKYLKKATNLTDTKYKQFTYDTKGNVLTARDEAGQLTTYTYNADNQRLTMTEAKNTTEQRVTTYEYLSSSVDLITKVTTPSVFASNSKEVITQYDANRNISSITTSGYQPNGTAVSRTTSMTYNNDGQLIQIDGPRTDVSDITTLTYYNCTTGNQCGQLHTVTNPLSQVTTYNTYDANGRVTRMTDANGLVTDTTYDNRGRVLTVTETPSGGSGRVTTFGYDPMGQLTSVTTPEGVVLTYTYDAAHDLKTITDTLGNKIQYGYDLRGNRDEEDLYDPQNTLRNTIDRTYDLRNRLDTVNHGGSITDYTFSAVGTLSNETDPNTRTTTYGYDGLERLITTIDALTGQSAFDHDVNDQITSVTAPNGVVTTFEYDDLGNLLKEISADRGTITYTYDAAGNMKTMTDAKATVITYSYDALNRVTLADAPGTADDISYTYDSCTAGVGRLCTVTHNTSTESYQYDGFGNITDHQQLTYTYTDDAQVETIIYPSGAVITYSYDSAGRVSQVSMNHGGTNTVLASNLDYAPFGPLEGMTLGNGLVLTKDHDTQYRITDQNMTGVLDFGYGYDANGNILSRTDTINPSSTFTYDFLNRLDTGSGSFGTRDYDYDANGNRTLLLDGGTTSYNYTASTNRLASDSQWTYTLDANGNTTQQLDGSGEGYLYGYTIYNQLATVTERVIPLVDTVVGTYSYNGLGQRIRKVANGTTTNYLYNTQGQLVAELDDTPTVQREYIYANGQLLAVLDQTAGTEVIVDNRSAPSGWQVNTSGQDYGSDYLYSPGSSGNDVTWTPTLSAGDYDTYAWWVHDSQYSSSVPYSIVHNSVTDVVNVDQSANGGSWQLLGNFTFDGSGAEYISVSESTGKTTADAVRLVQTSSGGGIQTVINYVHVDHLGTPVAMTDENGSTTWQATYDPFGLATVDVASTNTLNIRFPGQYYDEEGELHYNWHRHYDPKTGRYVTSDPIGLQGGLNTYVYVFNNPLRWSDPLGLEIRFICRPLDGAASITGKQHCFVQVTCPEEGWATTLSLFGTNHNWLGIPRSGRKGRDDPRDNPNSPDNAYNEPVDPGMCPAKTCAFEKAVLSRYNSFPNGNVPYSIYGPNSNSFAQDLATETPGYPTTLPPGAPNNDVAPGIGMPHPNFP